MHRIAIGALGALVALASCAANKPLQQNAPSSGADLGEVPFSRLAMRADEFVGSMLEVRAVYGGMCTISGGDGWLIFPLHDTGTSVQGSCTQMSPIVGALPRSGSEPLESLSVNDVVVARGTLTRRHVMAGQTSQWSLDIESIRKD